MSNLKFSNKKYVVDYILKSNIITDTEYIDILRNSKIDDTTCKCIFYILLYKHNKKPNIKFLNDHTISNSFINQILIYLNISESNILEIFSKYQLSNYNILNNHFFNKPKLHISSDIIINLYNSNKKLLCHFFDKIYVIYIDTAIIDICLEIVVTSTSNYIVNKFKILNTNTMTIFLNKLFTNTTDSTHKIILDVDFFKKNKHLIDINQFSNILATYYTNHTNHTILINIVQFILISKEKTYDLYKLLQYDLRILNQIFANVYYISGITFFELCNDSYTFMHVWKDINILSFFHKKNIKDRDIYAILNYGGLFDFQLFFSDEYIKNMRNQFFRINKHCIAYIKACIISSIHFNKYPYNFLIETLQKCITVSDSPTTNPLIVEIFNCVIENICDLL